MKLFSKLKNVLFEEEEIEVPVKEPTVKITPVEPPKKVEKRVFKESDEESIVTDRELFKAEKTFDFPVFDDNEFDNMKNNSLDISDIEKEKEPEKVENMALNIFDFEKPKIKKSVKEDKKIEEIKGRAYPMKREENKTSKFKPSPVISPVYGILDKNYKKEDLIVNKSETKKDIDVDVVRKKAFGTLEEDLEKTLNKPVEKFYSEKQEKKNKIKEDNKSIEDMLEETSYDVINIKKDMEENNDDEIYDNKVELKTIDKPKEKNKKVNEEENIENDLFDLIDSMYDNREDEE